MQVQVIKNESGLDEWVALEMQGNIEGSRLEGEFVGNFAWNKDGSEVVFVIGHHLLEGKVMDLNKPLMVMSAHGDPSDNTMIVDGVITRKVVFKNRPKPIISEMTGEN